MIHHSVGTGGREGSHCWNRSLNEEAFAGDNWVSCESFIRSGCMASILTTEGPEEDHFIMCILLLTVIPFTATKSFYSLQMFVPLQPIILGMNSSASDNSVSAVYYG